MIIESNIKSLNQEKVNLKDETVESSNAYLPKLYFCGMWIGSFNSDPSGFRINLSLYRSPRNNDWE